MRSRAPAVFSPPAEVCRRVAFLESVTGWIAFAQPLRPRGLFCATHGGPVLRDVWRIDCVDPAPSGEPVAVVMEVVA